MGTSCDTGKKGLDKLHQDNELRNKLSQEDTDSIMDKVTDTERRLERNAIVNYLAEKFSPDTIITEKDFDKAILDLFGKDERKNIIHKIDGIFQTNEMLKPVLQDIIREHILIHQQTGELEWKASLRKLRDEKTGKIIYEKDSKGKFKLDKKGKKIPVMVKPKGLDALSISSLKVVYKEIIDFVSATNIDDKDKWGFGLIEHYKLKLYTPKTTGKTIYADKNGSYFKFANEMSRYHERISYRINEFMFKPKTLKSKRNYGMNDVYKALDEIVDIIPRKDRNKILRANEKMTTIFTWMMNGRIFIGPKTIKDEKGNKIPNPNYGKLMIYQKRSPTGKQYKETKDEIFAWQDPVTLKDYRDGELYIPFTKKMANKLLKAIDKARIIDDEFFDYFAGEKVNINKLSMKFIKLWVKLSLL